MGKTFSLEACDKEAIPPDIMKTNFFGAFIKIKGAISAAGRVHDPMIIACFRGGMLKLSLEAA